MSMAAQISPTVLVSECDEGTAALLHSNLVSAGFAVAHTADADEVLVKARDLRPSLVILDTTLPGMEGKEVLRMLKSTSETRGIPVVLVSDHAEEIDRIVALELGADDYVSKPFSPRELALRVRAILSRRTVQQPKATRFSSGRLELDLDHRSVKVGGRPVSLSALDFRLLTVLMSADGAVVSREALIKSAWGVDSEISERTVDTQLRRLRGKLGAAADQIHTVRGFGYRIGE